MATNVVAPNVQRGAGASLRTWLIWLAVAVLGVWGGRFLLMAWTNYVHFDAAHYHRYWTFHWWLVGHIGGGTLALLLGPPQFSSYLRRRWLPAHRWLGRVYLLAILVGSFSGADMGLFHSSVRGFGDALVILAAAWFMTTLMAYVSVRRRQIAAHREWMVRSYVITFAFVVFRGLDEWGAFGGLSLEARLVMTVWVAWVLPLCATEIVLQWRRTMGAPVPRRTGG